MSPTTTTSAVGMTLMKIAAAIVGVVVVGAAAGAVVGPVADEKSINETEVEQQIVEDINTARQNEGLEPIPYSADLSKNARSYSEEMVNHDFYNHSSPISGGLGQRLACDSPAENINSAYYQTLFDVGHTGLQPADDPLVEAGYTGEIQLMNETEVAEYVTASWLGSESHRRNIMSPSYATGVGVATEETEHGTKVIVTQQFCG